jgi:hypothetical protein
VESFPVGSLSVKSLRVKILSNSDQNGKLSTDKVTFKRSSRILTEENLAKRQASGTDIFKNDIIPLQNVSDT